MQKLLFPPHLLPTFRQREWELTPFLRRQPHGANTGGPSFHTLLTPPKEKCHVSDWKDCDTSGWGHWVPEGEGSSLPLPSLPLVLPLTGEDGTEPASLLGPCGPHSGAGQRVWLLEAALGAHSSLLRAVALSSVPLIRVIRWLSTFVIDPALQVVGLASAYETHGAGIPAGA